MGEILIPSYDSLSSEHNKKKAIQNLYEILKNGGGSSTEKTSNKVTSISSSSTDEQYPSAKAVVGYSQPIVSVVQVASGTSTINAAVDNYYNIAGEVGTLGIALPTPTDTTKVKSIMFNLTTGSTPAITFSSSSPIDYFASYEIEANASYEVHALWNGSRWIIGATEINVTSNQ